MKKIISILLLLLFTVGCWAKDGKIKYGKCIRYEGEIVDKNPSGNGKLIIFDDVNDKKILMTICGAFSTSYYEPDKELNLIPITVNNGMVEYFDDKWSYYGETTIKVFIYPKSKEQTLHVELKSPELQHPKQFAKKIVSKTTISFKFDIDKNQIDYSSNSNIAKPMEVIIPEYDMILQQNFSDMSPWKESKNGSFEGTVMLNEDGSLSDFAGDFLSEQAIYRIKSLGTNCFVNEIFYKGNHFGLIDDQLFLDKVKIDNDQCKVSGELFDSSIFLYKGEYSQSDSQFNGTFILTNRESTPLDFYRGINSNSIKVKEGKLKKGDEEYEGSWDIKRAFNGKYVNKTQNLCLTECTISETGIIEGEGFMVQQNSISILGHYSNGGFNGEGEVQYPRHSSIRGILENSSLVSGTTNIECEGETAHFDIVLRNGSYEYSHQGKVYGKARLEDLFGALVNASYAALNIENPNIDKAPSFVTAVDLGLPSGTLWANVNIGATAPEGSGNYYAWGETTPKSTYNAQTYISNKKDADGFETWHDLGRVISGTKYDVARMNWGGAWNLPTEWQMQELVDKCTWEATTKNGVPGYKITGSNGNWIFLPAAGGKQNNELGGKGMQCFYWTGSAGKCNHKGCAAYLYASDSSIKIQSHTLFEDMVYKGRSVRPVYSK